MREFVDPNFNQPDYSKYADLKKRLKPEWLQFLQSMDCPKIAIIGIVIIAMTAIQKISESQVMAYMAFAAFSNIALLGVVKNVTRRNSHGETFTNPTQNPPES